MIFISDVFLPNVLETPIQINPQTCLRVMAEMYISHFLELDDSVNPKVALVGLGSDCCARNPSHFVIKTIGVSQIMHLCKCTVM